MEQTDEWLLAFSAEHLTPTRTAGTHSARLATFFLLADRSALTNGLAAPTNGDANHAIYLGKFFSRQFLSSFECRRVELVTLFSDFYRTLSECLKEFLDDDAAPLSESSNATNKCGGCMHFCGGFSKNLKISRGET
jgi:hypothetical protein